MKAEPKVWTIKDVAVMLSTHPSTIYRMLRRGEITGFKIGSDWRFNVEDIEHWRLNHPLGRTDTEKHNPRKHRPRPT
jgi:excisionase family DNA binding protein